MRLRCGSAQPSRPMPLTKFSAHVVTALRSEPLEVIAGSELIDRRYQEQRAAIERGFDRFRKVASLRGDGIVVFDFEIRPTESFSRYAPFLLHRDAYYSAGLVRQGTHTKISVMRNPWCDFENLDVGQLCQRFGGGGHARVGAIEVRPDGTADATGILSEIVTRLAASLPPSPVGDR